jgi:hypothetical protein
MSGTAPTTTSTVSTGDVSTGDAKLDAGLAKIEASSIRQIDRNMKVAEGMTEITGLKSAMGKIGPV